MTATNNLPQAQLADSVLVNHQGNTRRMLISVLAELLGNDSVRAVMLALATGSTLDHLVPLLGVVRETVIEADPEAVFEDDASLRRRAQLSWEGLTTAGRRPCG